MTGTVTCVRDGDTIEVGGVPIRLSGLAAPEANEPGGREATAAMRQMVHGREIRYQLDGTRTYDRCAGVCYLGENLDIKTYVRTDQGLLLDRSHELANRAPKVKEMLEDLTLAIIEAAKPGIAVAVHASNSKYQQNIGAAS